MVTNDIFVWERTDTILCFILYLKVLLRVHSSAVKYIVVHEHMSLVFIGRILETQRRKFKEKRREKIKNGWRFGVCLKTLELN